MKKTTRNIVIAIVLIIFGIVILKFNVYDTQFYSVFFQSVDIHSPLELEKKAEQKKEQ